MTYHKTYTIPLASLAMVQCGIASGLYRDKLVSLYWEFESLAGKAWQVHPVSPPEMSLHDLGEGEDMCIEIDLVSE